MTEDINTTADVGSYTETLTEQYSVNPEDSLADLSTTDNNNTDNNITDNNDVSTTDTDVSTADATNQDNVADIDNNEVEGIQERVNKHEKALAAVRKDLKTKGVDLNHAVQEYTTYGALSKQTMADLANAGYPKEVVEGFLATQRVLENNFTQEVYKSVGGMTEYNNITSWAANNMPQATLQAFNRAIDGNNLEAIKLMLDGMKARRNAALGTRNPSLLGKSSNNNSNNRSNAFANKDEMIKAMSDPRYNTDRAYNQAVVRKLLNSSNII